MSEWKKVEQPVPADAASAAVEEEALTPTPAEAEQALTETAPQQPAEPAEADEPALPQRVAPQASARYSARGNRRGRHKLAAPLGLLVLLLALTGVVSLIVGAVNMVQTNNAAEAAALRADMEDFLEPVLMYDLPTFKSVSEAGSNSLLSDDLLLAAIWPIIRADSVRQQQAQIAGEMYTSPYPMDDLGRVMVPLSEVDASYARLYGKSAVPQHHTIGDEEENAYAAYLYDPEQACYHIPAYYQSSQYETFLDTITREGDVITVRVGFVEAIRVGIDDKGNPLPLTREMADHFSLFKVEKTETGYRLVSVTREEK